jgi:hypothetical protein
VGNVDFSVNYMDVSDEQPEVEGRGSRKPTKCLKNLSMGFTGITQTQTVGKATGGTQSQSFMKN